MEISLDPTKRYKEVLVQDNAANKIIQQTALSNFPQICKKAILVVMKFMFVEFN